MHSTWFVMHREAHADFLAVERWTKIVNFRLEERLAQRILLKNAKGSGWMYRASERAGAEARDGS